MLDSRKAVGDDERCPFVHEVLQGFLYKSFGLGVQRRGGFVKNEHRRVLEHGARDAEPLALAAGQTAAAVADNRLVALRHIGDELMCVGNAGCLLYRLLPCHAVRRRLRGIHAERDVVIDGVVEKDWFLAYDAHEGTQVVRGELAYIRAVQCDGAFRRVVETRHKVSHGSLAAAGLSYQSDGLAFRDNQIDVGQHFAFRLIGKMHMVERYIVFENNGFRLFRLFDVRLCIQHSVNAFQRSHAPPYAVGRAAEVFRRVDDGVENHHVIDERRSVNRRMVGQDEQASEP